MVNLPQQNYTGKLWKIPSTIWILFDMTIYSFILFDAVLVSTAILIKIELTVVNEVSVAQFTQQMK